MGHTSPRKVSDLLEIERTAPPPLPQPKVAGGQGTTIPGRGSAPGTTTWTYVATLFLPLPERGVSLTTTTPRPTTHASPTAVTTFTVTQTSSSCRGDSGPTWRSEEVGLGSCYPFEAGSTTEAFHRADIVSSPHEPFYCRRWKRSVLPPERGACSVLTVLRCLAGAVEGGQECSPTCWGDLVPVGTKKLFS
ncbi:uncharacterized protein [Physeter macrocephalus]|uniref:Uncharacterized protein isoform X2 n=1 Tax=Physeter macrocephalus TaxID=9755 RepID=A0A455ABY0_PHYMC|nr:uncharacterized protein LOC114488072 isoform X2 [Physeter catodon]|eukprot:XP_028333123.1 uncharacterized protein LOC114488072 isoform X2 [Physeter catodon]